MNNSELKQVLDANIKLSRQNKLPLAKLLTIAESLQSSGMAEDALQLYEVWTANTTDDNKSLAMFNHGSLLQSTGKTTEAENIYRACLAQRPFFAQPCINLGLIQERRGEREQAIATWSQLLSAQAAGVEVPVDMKVATWNHVGRVREDLKQYQLAEVALTKSLALKPDQAGVIQHWVHIRQKACDWPVYQPLPGISANQMLMATSPLAMLAYSEDPVQQLLTAHAFVGRTYSFKEDHLCQGRVYQHAKKRIGYLSGDLCVHAVGLLLAELLEGHDRSKYEIYAYDFSLEDGTPHRQRLKKAIDNIRFVHALTDRQIAEVVVFDEIDVLIDLHGLSAGARPGIFALHPAPLQGTYLGFIGTTGMPWFDFVVTDGQAFPAALEPYFAEKPLRLSSSFIPLTPDVDQPLTVNRAQYGLPEDSFVMAAFGNSYKFTPELFSVWLDLVNEIPNAVLWLVDDNPATTANLQAFIYRHGASMKKIVFTPRAHYEEYKQRLKLADVFLDTFPYNCGSTTNNVVQAGLPMVTLYGKTMVSRMGLSILSSMDLGQYCTDNMVDYKQRVKDIAGLSVKDTSALREKIRLASMKPSRLSQELEDLIEQLMEKN